MKRNTLFLLITLLLSLTISMACGGQGRGNKAVAATVADADGKRSSIFTSASGSANRTVITTNMGDSFRMLPKRQSILLFMSKLSKGQRRCPLP